MAITISVPDALRQSVEAASGGKNTVLYDSKGYPSIMVVIPKFNLQSIDPSLGTGVHPAFIVNGVEKSEIFIGKFLAKVHDGVALSLPGQDPTVIISFDQAINYCKAKGSGWHLMTNAEWAAIALWCWKNGFQLRGNTYYGRSYDAPYETGRRVDGKAPGDTTGTPRTLTGSGPASWYHDNTPFGIADLNGNIWEWVGGLRLYNGEIQILPNNDAADNTKDQSSTSTEWKAIKQDGSLVAPGTAGTLKYDSVGTPGNGITAAQIDDVIDYQTDDTTFTSNLFQNLTADTGITVPAILKALALFPIATSGLGDDKIFIRNNGERIPLRGGAYYNLSEAGVFALNLKPFRSQLDTVIGFRIAYVG
jgi:sulfatase modifying factor 1